MAQSVRPDVGPSRRRAASCSCTMLRAMRWPSRPPRAPTNSAVPDASVTSSGRPAIEPPLHRVAGRRAERHGSVPCDPCRRPSRPGARGPSRRGRGRTLADADASRDSSSILARSRRPMARRRRLRPPSRPASRGVGGSAPPESTMRLGDRQQGASVVARPPGAVKPRREHPRRGGPSGQRRPGPSQRLQGGEIAAQRADGEPPDRRFPAGWRAWPAVDRRGRHAPSAPTDRARPQGGAQVGESSDQGSLRSRIGLTVRPAATGQVGAPNKQPPIPVRAAHPPCAAAQRRDVVGPRSSLQRRRVRTSHGHPRASRARCARAGTRSKGRGANCHGLGGTHARQLRDDVGSSRDQHGLAVADRLMRAPRLLEERE